MNIKLLFYKKSLLRDFFLHRSTDCLLMTTIISSTSWKWPNMWRLTWWLRHTTGSTHTVLILVTLTDTLDPKTWWYCWVGKLNLNTELLANVWFFSHTVLQTTHVWNPLIATKPVYMTDIFKHAPCGNTFSHFCSHFQLAKTNSTEQSPFSEANTHHLSQPSAWWIQSMPSQPIFIRSILLSFSRPRTILPSYQCKTGKKIIQ